MMCIIVIAVIDRKTSIDVLITVIDHEQKRSEQLQ